MRYIFILIIFFTVNGLLAQSNISEKKYTAQKDITLALATDSVNYILSTLTFKPHQFQLIVSPNGEAKITLGDGDGHFPFNFLELKNSRSPSGYQVNGIELEFYTPGTRAEHDWINFYKGDEKVAYIKLYPTPREVLTQLHNWLISVSKIVKSNNK